MAHAGSVKEFDLPHLLKLTRNYAEEDRLRSWRELLISFSFTGLCFLTTLPLWSLWIRIPGAIIFGISITRLFILYHDVVHGAIFRNSRLGRSICHFVGFFVLRPPAEWRRSHDFHHLHNTQIKTSHIGSFPLYTDTDFKNLSWLPRQVYKFARSPLVILFGYFFVFGLEAIKKLFFKDRDIQIQSLVAVVLHSLIIYTLYANWGFEGLVINLILPMTAACILGSYLFYIQHTFIGAELREDEEWDFAQSALVSSSCLRAGPILHWLTGNIGYHHIHHLNPKIPFYNLPRAMKEVKEFQNPTFVGLSPREIIQSLKLKLWSPKNNNWVDFKGRMV
jgi:omega-6 fatty acid desaturase (delta-12 desaturase)